MLKRKQPIIRLRTTQSDGLSEWDMSLQESLEYKLRLREVEVRDEIRTREQAYRPTSELT